jgi:hypothetical protein
MAGIDQSSQAEHQAQSTSSAGAPVGGAGGAADSRNAEAQLAKPARRAIRAALAALDRVVGGPNGTLGGAISSSMAGTSDRILCIIISRENPFAAQLCGNIMRQGDSRDARQASWLLNISEIVSQLETFDVPVIDRAIIERLFGLSQKSKLRSFRRSLRSFCRQHTSKGKDPRPRRPDLESRTDSTRPPRFRFRVWQWPDQDSVQHTKDCGIRADAQSERKQKPLC